MTARWRYALPSVITCTSIVAGLLSISEAVAGRFESAAWFNLLCVLLDKADGTAARLLRATSRFGVELDSLSDLIAFGVAPAVLVLSFLSGHGAGSQLHSVPLYRALIYGGSFLYVIAAALRLAKFNVLTERYGSEFFFGIPTTVCGALVTSYFLTARKYHFSVHLLEAMPGAMIVLALLMVSRIPLPKIGRRKTRIMTWVTVINTFLVYLFGLIRVFPEYLLATGLAYSVIGATWAVAKGVRPPCLDQVEATSGGCAAPGTASGSRPMTSG